MITHLSLFLSLSFKTPIEEAEEFPFQTSAPVEQIDQFYIEEAEEFPFQTPAPVEQIDQFNIEEAEELPFKTPAPIEQTDQFNNATIEEAPIDQFNNFTIEPRTKMSSIIRQLDIDQMFHPEFGYKTIVTPLNVDRGKSMVTIRIEVPCHDINDMHLIKIVLKMGSNYELDSIEITEPSIPSIHWRGALERNEDLVASSKAGFFVPKHKGIYLAESKLENEMLANEEMQVIKRVFKVNSSNYRNTTLTNRHFNPIATSKNCDVTLDPVPDNVGQYYIETQDDGSEIQTIQYCAKMTFTMVIEDTIAQIDVVREKPTQIGLNGSRVISARRKN